ncbi:N-acetylglucosamine kinase [Mycetocola sp.]|uniref:N-acetylglucosamine kinase n=1 Tax=Mycetocola sp. TaxID=1871042 RepID=UPI00398A24CF
MPFLLALDAGGTSTRATLVDRTGNCVSYARAGSGNPISSGTEYASAQLVLAAEAAVKSAGVAPSHIDSVLMAMAGMSVNASTDWISQPMKKRGFTGAIRLESDLLATFFSGTWEPEGYGVVAGTGSAGIRVRRGEVERSADGLGWLLGDVGSGFWIGHRVARAVMATLDGRAGPTGLTALLLEELGIPATGQRIVHGRLESLRLATDALYRLRPIELSRFAPLAFAVADDATAGSILADAAEALAGLFQAIASPNVTGPLVLGGSILAQEGVVAQSLSAAAAASGLVTTTHQVPDGMVGAIVLSLRSAGVEVGADVFQRIVATLAGLR